MYIYPYIWAILSCKRAKLGTVDSGHTHFHGFSVASRPKRQIALAVALHCLWCERNQCFDVERMERIFHTMFGKDLWARLTSFFWALDFIFLVARGWRRRPIKADGARDFVIDLNNDLVRWISILAMWSLILQYRYNVHEKTPTCIQMYTHVVFLMFFSIYSWRCRGWMQVIYPFGVSKKPGQCCDVWLKAT